LRLTLSAMAGMPGRSAAVELLEREAELERIDELIAAAVASEGRLLVIEGRAGVGKTALLAELRSRAARRGMSVFAGRGTELESGFAFGLVRQLFEPAVRRAPAGLFEGAAGLAAPVFGMSDGAPAEGQLFHGLYWLAADLAEKGPILLAVDDAHWADQASLRCLGYVLNRLEGLPMLVVLATRPVESGTSAEALAGIVADPGVRHLRLEALGEVSVAALIPLELGVEPDREFATACHRATAGNPLAVRVLLRDLAARGIQPTAAAARTLEETAPVEIGHRALAALAPMGEPAVRLARALSVAGDGLDLRLVSALSGLDPGHASDMADSLARVDLLTPERPLRFVHPLLRSAVYDAIPAGMRSRLHLRAAVLLAADGMDGEVVAAHLLRSEPASSEETVDRLIAAAPLAMRRGAPEAAIAYLRRALAEAPADERQAALLADLGHAEVLARDPAAAGHLRQALASCLDPVARATIRFDLAIPILQDDYLQALDLLKAALQDLGDREPEMSGRIEVLIAGYVASHPAAMARAPDPVPRMRHLAEGRGHAARAARLMLAFFLASRGQVREVVAYVEQGLDDGRFFAERDYAYGFAQSAGYALTIADEPDLARSLANGMLTDASSRGDVSAYVGASTLRAYAELQAGRLAEAEADGRAALDLGRQHDYEFAPYAAAFLSWILLERGQLDAAEVVIESANFKAGLAGSVFHAVLRLVRGMVRCAGSRTEEGIADFRAAGQVFQALNMPSIPWWRTQLALALPRSSMSEARQLAQTELGLARGMGVRRGIGIALRTVAALSPDADAVDLLREATTILENTPAVLELARVQLDLGAALRRLGHRIEARDPLRQALEIAARCGAVPLAERAREESLLAGARPRRPRLRGIDALTPAELRVARRAAEGRSNREIAQALFITSKTVADHLGSSYSKLQIASRAELAAALAADGG
jgi:DNA-binding CsgD family transcriptional regulator